MRRLWLLLAFALLVVIDLSLVPTLVLWIFVGSMLTSHGAPFLVSIIFALLVTVALVGLTSLIGKALRRAPRPMAPPPSG